MSFRLAAQAARALEGSAEERISYVRTLPRVGYTLAEEALARLEALLAHPPVSRMPNLLLFGETNNGKTAIAQAFVKRHPPNDDIEGDYVSVPILSVEAPPGGEESRLYAGMLRELYAPLVPPKRMDQLSFELLRTMKHCAVRMLLVDEIHNMLAAGPARQRVFLNAIKWLGNQLRIPIVAVGTHDARNAINTDPQIANRFERLEVRRWKLGSDYLQLLDSFEARLPLRRRSYLRSSEFGPRILSMSEGAIGHIVEIIRETSILAINERRDFMEPDDLARIPYQAPSERRR
jgi:Bacterial TniB protein